MDFSRQGLIGIENRGSEPEVLGHALSFGQSFTEVIREEGLVIPETLDQIKEFVVLAVVSSFPNLIRPTLQRFRGAEVDTCPRDINDRDELRALFAGLNMLSDYSAKPFRHRLRAANLSGKNGRTIFLDRIHEVPKYRKKVASNI